MSETSGCRIHRGAREIGGSCIEVQASARRLVLDVGLPLSLGADEEAVLPPVAGLVDGDPSLVGIVLSHAHPDHYGLIGRVGEHAPIFAGSATARILREAAFFTGSGADLHLAGELEDRRPLRIDPFTVTPYLVDHSAFDVAHLLQPALSLGSAFVGVEGELSTIRYGQTFVENGSLMVHPSVSSTQRNGRTPLPTLTLARKERAQLAIGDTGIS